VIVLHAVDGRSLKSIDVVVEWVRDVLETYLIRCYKKEALAVTHIVVDFRMQLEYDYNYPLPPRAWISRATKDIMVLGRDIVSSAT
jgi:hypothetical protein